MLFKFQKKAQVIRHKLTQVQVRISIDEFKPHRLVPRSQHPGHTRTAGRRVGEPARAYFAIGILIAFLISHVVLEHICVSRLVAAAADLATARRVPSPCCEPPAAACRCWAFDRVRSGHLWDVQCQVRLQAALMSSAQLCACVAFARLLRVSNRHAPFSSCCWQARI